MKRPRESEAYARPGAVPDIGSGQEMASGASAAGMKSYCTKSYGINRLGSHIVMPGT